MTPINLTTCQEIDKKFEIQAEGGNNVRIFPHSGGGRGTRG